MNKVLVGTTSWTEKTLIESGLFYPSAVKTPEERLKYYATKFPVTEVDSSYYSLPSERNAAAWVERTPKNFVLHLKAFRLFTGHQTDPSKFPKDIQQALGPREKKHVYYRDLPTRKKAAVICRLDSTHRTGEHRHSAESAPSDPSALSLMSGARSR